MNLDISLEFAGLSAPLVPYSALNFLKLSIPTWYNCRVLGAQDKLTSLSVSSSNAARDEPGWEWGSPLLLGPEFGTTAC